MDWSVDCIFGAFQPIAMGSDMVKIVLRPYMQPKPKMYALCMGLHRRLGADSPLNVLNVDLMQEIAKHIETWSDSEEKFKYNYDNLSQ
jgi:hypothetical protein